ncbi:MAG TPA: helix-turn-helix domain-containing protein [Roseiflexaceae bacterium]
MNSERSHTQHDTADNWLSLHDASALLGVATSTLRRWADSGRVPMKRTLGGHRRFPREAITRLVAAPYMGARPPADAALTRATEPRRDWSFDERELARQDWHAHFTAGPLTERMRGLGQRLLGLLIQYINRREDDHRFLLEARAVGANYGSETQEAGVSLHDTVEAFLFFRSAFSQLTMPLPGIAQPTDLAAAAGLRERLDSFMDAILLGVIAGYEGSETDDRK